MAMVSGVASPPLRRANSESRLIARRRAGSAILGSPGLNPCSPAPHSGSQQQIVDSKVLSNLCASQWSHDGARSRGSLDSSLENLSRLRERCENGRGAASRALGARTGNESKAPLPQIPECSRGSVRPFSPQNALKPAKRSRSTGGVPTSTSSGALAGCQHKSAGSDNELEQMLVTALNGKPGVRKADQENCSGMDNEEYFERLLNLFDGEENNNSLHLKSGRRASVSDSHGDNENNIRRKGTGFVHLKSSSEKVGARHARIDDHRADNENNLRRKGTGFVHLGSALEKERHARIVDHHGDNESNIFRKGTGFINLSSVPKEVPSVSFPDVDDNVNHIQRMGTGFVFLKHVAPRVRIADSCGDNVNHIQRKGTGFVDLTDCELLPSSPGSCSTRTVDSRSLFQDASDTDVASDEYDSADACEEHLLLTDIQ